ncbi:MAG: hypothetical protein LBS57_09255 [Treponema sp.]|jgi:hypothetical protein|nr:hypothetical protein [Treponema sp.]
MKNVFQKSFVGILRLVMISGLLLFGCDTGTGGDSKGNTLTVTGISQSQLTAGYLNLRIGIFPRGTTVQQAESLSGVVAGADYKAVTVKGSSAPYTLIAPLWDASTNYSDKWSGSGIYDIFAKFGGSVYYKRGVSFDGSSNVTYSVSAFTLY